MSKLFWRWRRHRMERFFYLFAIFIVMMGIALLSGGCGPKKVTVQQYQFLNGAADLRLAVLQGAVDYYSMGMIDEATKEKVIEIDKHVQAAGKLATAKLNEMVMLENLQTLDPESVTPEQIAAAAKAYADAKAAFRAQWRQLTLLVDPYLMKWLQEAAAKKKGG